MNRLIFLAVPLCLLAALAIYPHPQHAKTELEVVSVRCARVRVLLSFVACLLGLIEDQSTAQFGLPTELN
jgi:hypothetical protein